MQNRVLLLLSILLFGISRSITAMDNLIKGELKPTHTIEKGRKITTIYDYGKDHHYEGGSSYGNSRRLINEDDHAIELLKIYYSSTSSEVLELRPNLLKQLNNELKLLAREKPDAYENLINRMNSVKGHRIKIEDFFQEHFLDSEFSNQHEADASSFHGLVTNAFRKTSLENQKARKLYKFFSIAIPCGAVLIIILSTMAYISAMASLSNC